MKTLLDKIESYGFECEGGPLRNCVDWHQLQSQIEQLQADNARLQEQKAQWRMEVESKLSSLRVEVSDDEDVYYNGGIVDAIHLVRSMAECPRLTWPGVAYRSNWLAEQKAQWRREVLKQVLRLESPDEYDYMVVLSSDIRRLAESTKAETDSLQNPAGKY